MNRNNRSNSPFSQQRSVQGTSRDKSPSPMKPKEFQENQQLDDEFVNTMLEVEQKYTVLNKHERIRIEQWTKKLCSVTTNKVWKKNRNLYAKELLDMVNFSKLREPFTRMPPDGPLPKFNRYDFEKPKKSDNLQTKEEGSYMNTDSRQRSVNSQHVQSQNYLNNPSNSLQQRSQSNLHANNQIAQVNTQQFPQFQQQQQQQQYQQQQQQQQLQQQQQHQYYGTASFNYNEADHVNMQHVQFSDQVQNQNMGIGYNQPQKSGIISRGSPRSSDEVKRASRSNSQSKKAVEDNNIIQQQAEEIKHLHVQLQISESKYMESVSNYQEDMKNLEQQHQRQISDMQLIIQQYNQHLNEKNEENNQLQMQVKKLRNILSNIGIQMIHIKDSLPQQQYQQLDEIVQQLSDLNVDNNISNNINTNNLIAKQQSDLSLKYNYQNDTNENYATPQSNIFNDGNSQHLAQPLNNSVVSKKQMSPNVRTKFTNQNNESSQILNSFNSTSQQPIKQQIPQNTNDGAISNRSKTSILNNNLLSNQVNSNLNNIQQSSALNINSSRSNSRPNAALSNKNSINSTNRYFPSVSSQLSNNNNYQGIQRDVIEEGYQSNQPIQQQQQQQQLQAQPQQSPASNISAAAITNGTSQIAANTSSRYEQQSQNQPKNSKLVDPMPISFKNEQDTQEFLNYLDNFQKRTEKLKSETSQFLKVNEKYTHPVKK